MDVNNCCRLAVIGDTFCDIFTKIHAPLNDSASSISLDGGDTLADLINIIAGGSGLNVSCHIKELCYPNSTVNTQLPLQVHFFSAIGEDKQGQLCLDVLKKTGVNTDSVKIIKGGGNGVNSRTGTCIVFSHGAERSFVSDRGVIDSININWFDEKKLLSQDHIHLAGFYNCSGLYTGMAQFLEKAVSKRITTSLNPQHDATEKWGYMEELCPYLTLIFGNIKEVTAMASAGKVTDSTAKTVMTSVGVLLKWGCKYVVTTYGRDGAKLSFLSSRNEITIVSCSAVDLDSQDSEYRMLDSTGAGDSFVSGFLGTFIDHKKTSIPETSPSMDCLVNSLRVACLLGGHCCTGFGGSAINPTRFESFQKKYAPSLKTSISKEVFGS